MELRDRLVAPLGSAEHRGHAVAAGEGADEADALLALWATLTGQHESAEAIAVTAEAYFKMALPRAI